MQRQKNIPVVSLANKAGDRFWSRVDKTGGPAACWPWTGPRYETGYGRLRIIGIPYRAPRIAYFLAHGTDPADKFVCHRCDNPPCCNPAHLFLGTTRQNGRDMASKGRAKNQHGEQKRTEKRTTLRTTGGQLANGKN